jgi:hypothetical protein
MITNGDAGHDGPESCAGDDLAFAALEDPGSTTMTTARTIATTLMISASIGLTACIDTVSLGSGDPGGSEGVAPLTARSNPCLGDQIATLAENQHPTSFVLDQDRVYWIDAPPANGLGQDTPMALKSVPKGGGAVVVLATATSFRQIHVADQNIYWMSDDGTDHVTASLYSTPKSGGGAITTIATLPAHQYLVDVDGTSVYLQDTVALTFSSMPRSGGAQTILASSIPPNAWFLVDAQNIYWNDDTDTFSLPKAGGTPTHLASQPSGAYLRRQNTQNLYFILANDPVHSLIVAKNGGSQTLLDNGTIPMAVDDHCIYTTPSPTSPGGAYDTLVGAPMSGGAPSTLATGLGSAAAMAADESGLYWIHPYSGLVMKMAR